MFWSNTGMKTRHGHPTYHWIKLAAHRYSVGISFSCHTGCEEIHPSYKLLKSMFGFSFAKSLHSIHSLAPSCSLDYNCRDASIQLALGRWIAGATFIFSFSACVHGSPAFWTCRQVGYWREMPWGSFSFCLWLPLWGRMHGTGCVHKL